MGFAAFRIADGRIQPNCFRNKEASKTPQEALLEHWESLGPPDVKASKLMNKRYTNLIHHAQILWVGLGGCAKRKQFLINSMKFINFAIIVSESSNSNQN